MSRHMIIWDEGFSADSVRVYTEDPSVLVISDREDLQVLKEIPEASRAGIYILMGEDNRYVGQASSSVWARINSHNKNKDWWTRVLFFSRVDGHLDKSQLDYLESKLIRQFSAVGFNVDNKDSGNSSYIGPYQRGQAENLLSTVEAILAKDIGLDIFSRKSRSRATPSIQKTVEISVQSIGAEEDPQNIEILALKENSTFVLSSVLAGEFESKYWKQLYIKYFSLNWASKRAIMETDESLNNLFFITSEIAEDRRKFHHDLDDEYSLFVNCSRFELEKRLHKIASAVGDSIKIEENL
jgi:hypothetical protein